MVDIKYTFCTCPVNQVDHFAKSKKRVYYAEKWTSITGFESHMLQRLTSKKPGIYAGLRFSFRMTGYVPFYQNRIKIVRNQNIDKDMGLRYNKFPNDNR